MEITVIHLSDVIKTMNHALLNHQQVSLKAWKVGKGPEDPERGSAVTFDRVYVTSHSPMGVYNLLDPLAEAKDFKYRHVSEALIFEFMGKEVIW